MYPVMLFHPLGGTYKSQYLTAIAAQPLCRPFTAAQAMSSSEKLGGFDPPNWKLRPPLHVWLRIGWTTRNYMLIYHRSVWAMLKTMLALRICWFGGLLVSLGGKRLMGGAPRREGNVASGSYHQHHPTDRRVPGHAACAQPKLSCWLNGSIKWLKSGPFIQFVFFLSQLPSLFNFSNYA